MLVTVRSWWSPVCTNCKGTCQLHVQTCKYSSNERHWSPRDWLSHFLLTCFSFHSFLRSKSQRLQTPSITTWLDWESSSKAPTTYPRYGRLAVFFPSQLVIDIRIRILNRLSPFVYYCQINHNFHTMEMKTDYEWSLGMNIRGILQGYIMRCIKLTEECVKWG